MQIRLNLATKALQTHRRFLVGAGGLAFVAGILFLSLGWHVYAVRKVDSEFRAEAEVVRQQLIASQRERDDLERFFTQPENARLHDRAAFLNSIGDAASFNWTLMFMDLERVLPGGVRVISIEPVQLKGRILLKIKVGASSEDAKLQFIHALEQSMEFSSLELVSEHQAPAGDQTDKETMDLNVVYSRS